MLNTRKHARWLIILAALFTLPSICYAADYWINQTVQVPAGGAYYWSGTFYAGNQLYSSFTSNGGDIKFLILDAANFAKYQSGQSFIAR